jgi:hypothetical protein
MEEGRAGRLGLHMLQREVFLRQLVHLWAGCVDVLVRVDVCICLRVRVSECRPVSGPCPFPSWRCHNSGRWARETR